MVEHSTADREVPGSNPGVPLTFCFGNNLFHKTGSYDAICYNVYVKAYCTNPYNPPPPYPLILYFAMYVYSETTEIPWLPTMADQDLNKNAFSCL